MDQNSANDPRPGELARYAEPRRRAVWDPPARSCEPVADLVLRRDRETPQYVVFTGKTQGFDWIVTAYVRKGTGPALAEALRVTGIEVVPPAAMPGPGEPVTRIIELED